MLIHIQVIKACDFVGTDGYPFYEDSVITRGSEVFWRSVNKVKAVVKNIKPGMEVWITETGW